MSESKPTNEPKPCVVCEKEVGSRVRGRPVCWDCYDSMKYLEWLKVNHPEELKLEAPKETE